MKHYLTLKELKIVYKLLEFQHISYENIDAIFLVRRISKIIDLQEKEVKGD